MSEEPPYLIFSMWVHLVKKAK